jgi:glycosyltransferase involved in cell wall biosynthesis
MPLYRTAISPPRRSACLAWDALTSRVARLLEAVLRFSPVDSPVMPQSREEANPGAGESGASVPEAAVVMPTYHRGAGLSEIIAPLLADPFPREIIVVVDGCDDGSIELLEERARADSRLKPVWISNSGEMGAREAGIKLASAEIVILLDDDVLTRPGLSRKHAAWHGKDQRLVVLGYMPTVLPAARTASCFATYLYEYEYEKRCKRYEAEPEAILRNLWAGNVSMKRSDALAVGLASSEFSARYHPDREFGLRCLKAGLVGVFDRRIEAEHRYQRDLDAFRRDARAQGVGRKLLYDLHSDVLGSMPEDEFEQGILWPLPSVVRLTRRHRIAYGAISRAIVAVIHLAGQLKWFRVETAAGKLLRRIEQGVGAADLAG